MSRWLAKALLFPQNGRSMIHCGERGAIRALKERRCGRRIVALGAFLALAGCGEDDPHGAFRRAAGRITAQSLLADVRVLSADDMQGRATGTAGEDKAAAFIAAEFSRAGLLPLGVSPPEASRPEAHDYFQPVHLVGMKKVPASSRLEIRNQAGSLAFTLGESLTFWSTAQQDSVEIADAPLLFVGYGVEAPEHDWDDFKGIDLEGKVLLFLNNDPPVVEEGVELFGGEARTYYGRWNYKFEQAMKHGAAGALMIHTTESASYPFSVVENSGIEESFALDLPGAGYQVDLLGWVDRQRSELIAGSLDKTLEELFSMAAERSFEPIDTGYRVTAHIETIVRRLESKNVIGVLEGSDPVLKEQLIVFSAHYDHMGVKPGGEGEDLVFNGAWDNASGTACLLSLARAFASLQERPRRSVAFLACGAEERGLLGSRWFVSRPPIQLRRVVANYNVDMTQIFGITTDLAAIGHDSSTLGDHLRQAAASASSNLAYSLQVVGDRNPAAGSFYRSDQVNFAKKGIPALFIKPGTRYVEPLSFDPKQYHTEHYHQVSDEVNEYWNLAGAERDMRILFRAALLTASHDEMPRWVEGNEFEAASKELYGF